MLSLISLISLFADRCRTRSSDEEGVIPAIMIVILVILVLAVIGLFSFCGD